MHLKCQKYYAPCTHTLNHTRYTETSGDNSKFKSYLNFHAVILSPSDEATNARLEYRNTLQLTMMCMAEQKSVAVSLKLCKKHGLEFPD